MWRRPTWAVLALVLTVTGLSVGAVPAGAEGGIEISLVDVPVDRADDPRARTAIVDHLEPGESIERRVRVRNTTAGPVEVSLYPAASAIVDGRWAPRDGRAENDLTTWTTVSPPEVTVAAGATELATVQVTVPDDAVDGERYAVVWAEPPAVRSGDITFVTRTGVRMYVSVGGGEEPATDFSLGPLEAEIDDAGTPWVAAEVHNVGGRALDLSGHLELVDESTRTVAGPFRTSSSLTLVPGSRSLLRVELPAGIAPGPWQATLTARSGPVERTRTDAVTFGTAPGPTDAGEGATAATRPIDTDGAATDPWTALLAVVAVLSIAGVGAAAVSIRARAHSASTARRPSTTSST